MKKLLFLLLFICTITFSYSQYTFSQLNVRMVDSSRFVMVVDNVKYPYPTNIFNLNLFPGLHLITVQREGGLLTLYNGLIELPANTSSYAYIDYNQNFKVYNLSSINYTNALYPGNTIDANPAITPGMNSLAFYNLKVQMSKANSSRQRMNMAKNSISQNNVLSGQLAELVRIVEFESDRMELAKFAYRFTYDQENFDILAPSFSFETSMKEVDKYINEQRVAIKELDE